MPIASASRALENGVAQEKLKELEQLGKRSAGGVVSEAIMIPAASTMRRCL